VEFSGIVFDASAMLAIGLPDEKGQEVEGLLHKVLKQNGQILVPPLFWYEVLNGLVMALNKNRISGNEILVIEADLAALPIASDQAPPAFVRQRIREYALRYNLSFYDASYLELAERFDLPLKTFDSHLLELKDTFKTIL